MPKYGDAELRIRPHNASQYRHLETERKPDNNISRTFSAYTVAELGEMLKGLGYGYPIWVEHDNKWHSCQSGQVIVESTEADARAKLLIYLKENNLIEE